MHATLYHLNADAIATDQLDNDVDGYWKNVSKIDNSSNLIVRSIEGSYTNMSIRAKVEYVLSRIKLLTNNCKIY